MHDDLVLDGSDGDVGHVALNRPARLNAMRCERSGTTVQFRRFPPDPNTDDAVEASRRSRARVCHR